MQVGNDGGKDSSCAQLLKEKSERAETGLGYDFSFLNSMWVFFSHFKDFKQTAPGILCRRGEMYSFCLCPVHMVKDAQNASAIFMHIACCAPCFQQSTV